MFLPKVKIVWESWGTRTSTQAKLKDIMKAESRTINSETSNMQFDSTCNVSTNTQGMEAL